MTRAKDTLAIYAKQGKGTDTTPTKFLREFMGRRPTVNSGERLRRVRCRISFSPRRNERIALEHSNVAAWLLMQPRRISCPA